MVQHSNPYMLLLFSHSIMSLCDPMDCRTPSFPVLHHLQEFAQTHVHWCHPTTSSCHSLLLPSTFHTIRIFSNELALRIRWQNIGASASASVLPMNIQDWFSLGLTGLMPLLSKGTLQSLLQQHSLKASVLRCSAFFMVHLSHPLLMMLTLA